MNDKAFRRLMKQARKTNAARDKDDRAAGWQAPPDGSLDDYLRTAISAVEAGIRTEDYSTVAEGLAMLQDIDMVLRGYRRGTFN